MTTHPLAERFDGAAAIIDQIQSREPDRHDHPARTRQIIDTFHPNRITTTVTEVIDETSTTKTFRLARPDRSSLPPFLAGQYINIFTDGTSRPYAISSSPAERRYYDITVRRVPQGRISNLLIDNLKTGAQLITTGPMGTFHHNPLFHGDDVVFLAGGSGVVPALSMIRDIADNNLQRRFHLIYGSRRADDVIFADELDQIASYNHGMRVDHVIAEPPTGWAGASGFLTADTISTLAGPLDDRMVYVCGPQALYPYALEQLTTIRHPRRRIRFEANGAPADPTAQPHWPAAADPNGNVRVTVDGTSFHTPRNRPLLDALEDNGIRPEAACRSGECSLCRVRVLSGTVHTAQEAKLRLSDPQAGYTHSCVAYPLTDIELSL